MHPWRWDPCLSEDKLIDYADGGFYSTPTARFRRRTVSADAAEERPNNWRYGNWRIYPRMPSYCQRQEAYHCIVCGKHYRNIHECMIHMVTRCDLERVKVRCGVCGQGYHTERELELHYKSRHVNLQVSTIVYSSYTITKNSMCAPFLGFSLFSL